jgi:hypothetical protein
MTHRDILLNAVVYKRTRANSLPTNALGCLQPARSQCTRSASEGSDVIQATQRVRIAYSDDTLCESSLANMRRLVRAAHASESESSISAALARKALRYRKKLERARAVNMDDPAF